MVATETPRRRATDRPDAPHQPHGLLRRCVIWWKRKRTTSNGSYVVLFIVAGLSGLFIVNSIERNSSADATREARQLRADNYRIELAAHNDKVAAFQFCMEAASTRVNTRDGLRATFVDNAVGIRDTLIKLFPDSVDARRFGDEFVADRQAFTDANYAPLNLQVEQEKCDPAGLAPVPPD